MKPIIAIVGRPNVGKSTLFNRIVGRRQAIVNDTPGVTRDRHYANADWCGQDFVVIDTGGLVGGDEKSVQNLIKKQTLAAVEEADVVVCVLDGREGPTHLDKHIVELLRKSGKPVFYAVNKVDKTGRQGGKETRISEFYELGISSNQRPATSDQQLFAVSAEHGIGVDDLLDEVVKSLVVSRSSLATSDQRLATSDSLRVAVIGRPNSGKSTLINRLSGQERVIVHETPGTTRDSIDVEIKIKDKKYTFVDTAGLKKKGKTLEALDKFSAVKTLNAIERATIVILVVDSNEGFTHQDSSLLDYAYTEGKAVIVLFNKWDIIAGLGSGTQGEKEYREFYSRKLLPLHRVPFLYISARTGLNINSLFPEIDRVAAAMHNRLPTAELNKILEDIKEGHNIPSYRSRAVKLYYATQVKTVPPTFVVFSNYPEGIGEGYKRYLINRLQDIIGNGVPIRIKFKKK